MKNLNNLLRSSQLLSVRAWIQTQEDWITNYILFPFCLSWAPATHVLKTKLIIFNHKSSLISWLSSTKKHHTILSNSLFNDLIPFPFTPYLPWIIVILQYLLTSLFLPLIPAYSIHAPFYSQSKFFPNANLVISPSTLKHFNSFLVSLKKCSYTLAWLTALMI